MTSTKRQKRDILRRLTLIALRGQLVPMPGVPERLICAVCNAADSRRCHGSSRSYSRQWLQKRLNTKDFIGCVALARGECPKCSRLIYLADSQWSEVNLEHLKVMQDRGYRCVRVDLGLSMRTEVFLPPSDKGL